MAVGSRLPALKGKALRMKAGAAKPEEVAVVGFDDSPIAVTVRPMLTTVRQPIQAMGREMAELLLRQISDPVRAPSRVIFPTELVVRESSTPRGAGVTGEPSDRAAVSSQGADWAARHGGSAGR